MLHRDLLEWSLKDIALLWLVTTLMWSPALNVALSLAGIRVALAHQLWIVPLLAGLSLIPLAGAILPLLVGWWLLSRVAEDDSTSYYWAALLITQYLVSFLAYTVLRYLTGE